MKAIIVDDEQAARNVLQNLIQLSHPEIEVIDACSNLPEAVMSIRSRKPDLVFLDVEMPQFAGFEIVKFFSEIDFQIIFVTAYNQYAVKAFELNAVDYLVKPVQRTRLKDAIERAQQQIDNHRKITNYHEVIKRLEEEQSPTLTISESGNQHIVKTSNICAVHAQGAYCLVILKSGKRMMLSKNIGLFEKELSKDALLFRSHKSWIINLREIAEIQLAKEQIILNGGITAKLSRFKKKSFDSAFSEFKAGVG